MKDIKLENGSNWLNVPGYGMLHVWVKEGNLDHVTIYNAKVTKKRTIITKGHSHVQLDIKVDNYD